MRNKEPGVEAPGLKFCASRPRLSTYFLLVRVRGGAVNQVDAVAD